MSPDAILYQGDAESFPRVSGDEPGSEVQALLARKVFPA